MNDLKNKNTDTRNTLSPHEIKRERLRESIKQDKRVLNVFIFLATAIASWGLLGINDGPLANKVTESEKNEFYKTAFMNAVQSKVEAQPQDVQQSAMTLAEDYLSGTTSAQVTDNDEPTLTLDFEKISRDAHRAAEVRAEAARDDNHGQSMGRIFLGAMFAVGALGKRNIIHGKINVYEERYSRTPKP